MPKRRSKGSPLATREQQIMEVLFQLGRGSVADVRQRLNDPPSYSAVRTMIGQLEKKGLVRRDRSEITHYYSPVESPRAASRSALRNLVETFFPKSPAEALAALIDDSAKNLTDDDFDRLEEAIRRARREGR